MLKSKIFVGSLVGATAFSAIILSSSTVSAETYTKSALIRVQAACTMDGTVTTAHSATIAGGTYREGIGESIVSVACNDAGGFGVYAIGFTGDTEGNNVLAHGTENVSIATGTATSGNTSNWAMKLEAYENGNNTPTIENGYGSYKAVPDDYTLVASYPNATSATDDVIFRTYYSAYISMTQRAGTYTGKVKYVMVHPSTGPAPQKEPVSFDNAFNAAGKTKVAVGDNSYYKQQDMTTFICDSVAEGQVTELVDIRDNTIYHVGKLADGNCWMLDNLALDPTLPAVQTNLTEATTNASAAAITNYKIGGNPDNNAGWSTGAVSYETSTSVYDQPRINVDSVNVVPSDSLSTNGSWKIGVYYNYCAASMGTYCYAENQGVDRSSSSAIDAEYDICPANWRMPTGGDTSSTGTNTGGGEYKNLARVITGNSYASQFSGEPAYTDFRTALRLPLSGGYYNGLERAQGTLAYVWSSTYYSGSSVYNLVSETATIISHNNSSRPVGHSIRCIVK